MPDISVTHEEIAFLVNQIPPAAAWPVDPEDMDILPAGHREAAHGGALRLKLVAARQYSVTHIMKGSVDLFLTLSECWLLDMLLWRADYTTAKMNGGTPVIRLVEKLWDAMIVAHAEQLPQYGGVPDGVKYITPKVADAERMRLFLAQLDEQIGKEDA